MYMFLEHDTGRLRIVLSLNGLQDVRSADSVVMMGRKEL